MKFALVLILSVCAFAAQPSSAQNEEFAVLDELTFPMEYELELYGNLGLLDKLRELIQKIIQMAKEATEKIQQQIEKIVTIALEKIQNIVDRANELIKRIIQAVLDKIKEAAAAGGIAKRCADNATAELQEIAQTAQEDLQECASSAIKQIMGIREDVDVQIEGIKENIDKLSAIVSICLEENGNPISVIRCITNQATEIRDNILNLLKNAASGVAVVAKRSLEITSQTNKCGQKTVAQLQQQVLATAKKFQICLKESKPQTYLLN